MRKSQTQRLGNVIGDCLREMKIDRKLKEVNIIGQWENLMGKMVSARTTQIYIKNGMLHVHVTSAVLKSELLMMKQDIIDKLNENAGEKLIAGIIIR